MLTWRLWCVGMCSFGFVTRTRVLDTADTLLLKERQSGIGVGDLEICAG